MKKILLVSILLVIPTNLFGQSFSIDENGIIMCEGVPIGTTGIIFGEIYESVDRDLLIQRRDEGSDLTKVCVSNITDLENLFANSSFNQPIGNWDVSNVTVMSGMFQGSQFNQPIGNWNVSNVAFMNIMFADSPFNQPIGVWDVNNVITMWGMFRGSQFNHPIGDWDVSNVIDMYTLFQNSQFNQPINLWCVSEITTEPQLFSDGSPLTTENKPVWGTCPVLQLIPNKTTQIAPENNMGNVSKTTHFVWNADSLSTVYQLQVSEGFDPIVIDTLVSDTVFVNTNTLKGGATYYWRVRGINSERTYKGNPLIGEWSSVWSFATKIETSIESEEEYPIAFILSQNYPNPFNPTTKIRFSLPQSLHVRLEVYSVTGQLVSTLINGTMSYGHHTVIFDGKNLSSGLYIYRLTTADFNQSRLMNLIK